MKSDNHLDLFFLGDTYFGEWHMRLRGRKGKSDILSKRGYRHFGRPFEALLAEGDEVIVNLECAVTAIERSPLEGTAKKHLYAAQEGGTIEALKALGVTAALLSNNHAVDYGKAGLVDSIEALERAGIRPVGGGRTLAEARKPLLIEKRAGEHVFKAAVMGCYNYGKASAGYGFYAGERTPGVAVLDADALTREIAALKSSDPDRLCIVSPHWGPNYAWRTFSQQQQGESLVRSGADLVVGHSAHMIQEVEYYRGRPIVYSIGNFLMNGDGEYRRRNLPPFSFIARLHLEARQNGGAGWLALYPIVTDNTATDFNPRFAEEKEFEQVCAILRSHHFDPSQFDRSAGFGRDGFGHYIHFALHGETV